MIEILPLPLDRLDDAKWVMAEVCNGIWHIKPTVDELLVWFDETGEFDDLNHLQSAYFENRGMFLLATDDGTAVGTGSIKYLSETVCELKRMWVLKDYRAHGVGLRIAEELLRFAKESGYKSVRLEVYDPPGQQRAVAFYKRLGFSEIELYKNSPAKLAMEKLL